MKSLLTTGWSIAFAALTMLATLSGCGPNDGLLPVYGTVTLDGEPVHDGSISFMPVNGGSTGGGLIKDGEISARSAPGEMAVQIHAHRMVKIPNPTREQIERGITEVTESIIPGVYNRQSQLRIHIDSSNQTFHFDLKKDGTIPEGMGKK